MIHYTIAIDDEQAALLIDLLTAAIALAEQQEAHPSQSVRIVGLGTPILDDLRAARRAAAAKGVSRW